jgi:hypothetical protein
MNPRAVVLVVLGDSSYVLCAAVTSKFSDFNKSLHVGW